MSATVLGKRHLRNVGRNTERRYAAEEARAEAAHVQSGKCGGPVERDPGDQEPQGADAQCPPAAQGLRQSAAESTA